MGCSSEYPDGYNPPSESDRLLGRIILAFQAETGLERVHMNGIAAYMHLVRGVPGAEEVLPTTSEEVVRVVKRLERLGYVSVQEEKLVSITLIGLLVCGPLRIPEEIANSFGEKIEAEILSRA